MERSTDALLILILGLYHICSKGINSFIVIWQSVFWSSTGVILKHYFNNGMMRIIDLFDPNGNFGTFKSINNLTVKTSYVEYVGLRNAIFEYKGTCNMTQVKQKI